MRFPALALLASLALAAPAVAPAQTYVADDYVGRLTSTGTSVNSSSVSALGTTGFWVGPYTVQCTGAVRLRQVDAADGTASSTTGILLEAGEKWPIRSISGRRFVAIISVSGTVSCDFWRVHQ